ncbi:MAG: BON domain-containing protein [Gemmatimonadaceae bacterium]
MPRDFEDLYDLDDLSEDDLRALVREQLAQYATLDADSILVDVERGTVVLRGRVGTGEEREIAEHVLTDVLGIKQFRNELLIAAVRRDEEPEAADEAAALDADGAAGQGEDGDNESPEARHLEDSLDARLYGTPDVSSAIERGTPWVPPTTPTPEGHGGRDGA